MSEKNQTVALDFNDLIYYDKKIKAYINSLQRFALERSITAKTMQP